jgi:hypothetical protein
MGYQSSSSLRVSVIVIMESSFDLEEDPHYPVKTDTGISLLVLLLASVSVVISDY